MSMVLPFLFFFVINMFGCYVIARTVSLAVTAAVGSAAGRKGFRLAMCAGSLSMVAVAAGGVCATLSPPKNLNGFMAYAFFNTIAAAAIVVSGSYLWEAYKGERSALYDRSSNGRSGGQGEDEEGGEGGAASGRIGG